MTADPLTTLVRVRRGCCGPVTPEDGVLVRLPADLADELVRVGDAVRVPPVDEDELDNERTDAMKNLLRHIDPLVAFSVFGWIALAVAIWRRL